MVAKVAYCEIRIVRNIPEKYKAMNSELIFEKN